MNTKIGLSIIIPTLGRKEELRALLESIIHARINMQYEIIVVDQNPTGFLKEIEEAYKNELPLKFYNVQFKGVSRAKNFGIAHANGTTVCFPDDDAEFLPDTIEKALGIMEKTGADCVFGKTVSRETGEDSICRYQKEAKYLTLTDFEGAFVEATMFACAELLREFPYDEELGVGTIHGAEEGYDLVYRLLCANRILYYSPEILLYHPSKVAMRVSDSEVRRAFYYSCGLGYLCRKHGFRAKYRRRALKLAVGIPVIAVFRHRELKYFQAQYMGLRLGYKYI